jgi:hypothetical protein
LKSHIKILLAAPGKVCDKDYTTKEKIMVALKHIATIIFAITAVVLIWLWAYYAAITSQTRTFESVSRITAQRALFGYDANGYLVKPPLPIITFEIK